MESRMLPALLCLVLCMGSVFMHDKDQDSYQVKISGNSVTITCPKVCQICDLKRRGFVNGKQYLINKYTESDNGKYTCFGNNSESQLYLKAQVCDTCTEISIPVVVGVLAADCLVTFGVALVVYFGCKKKVGPSRDGGMSNGARQKGKLEDLPPVPKPDYEQIRKGPRDEYDRLGPRHK